MYFFCTATFVLAIIPFDQIRVDFGHAAKAGQLASARGANQGTREHPLEFHTGQPLPKPSGIPFPAIG
jgi:hypothetical protein